MQLNIKKKKTKNQKPDHPRKKWAEDLKDISPKTYRWPRGT